MMKFSDLKFVRLTQIKIFNSIPKYLFEQVKGRSWSVERLYKFASLFLANTANCFWVLKNDRQVIKGVLWVVIDILSEKLNLIVFSIDEEYQDDGNLKDVLNFLYQLIEDFNKIGDNIKLKEKINWITAEPEKLDRIGWKQPETIMVEV